MQPHRGILSKRSHGPARRWQRRYFSLERDGRGKIALSYFLNHDRPADEKKGGGKSSASGNQVTMMVDSVVGYDAGTKVLKIRVTEAENRKMKTKPHQIYELKADTDSSATAWMAAFRGGTRVGH